MVPTEVVISTLVQFAGAAESLQSMDSFEPVGFAFESLEKLSIRLTEFLFPQPAGIVIAISENAPVIIISFSFIRKNLFSKIGLKG